MVVWVKRFGWLIALACLLISGLVACGESSPTAKPAPTVQPTATPSPPPAYFAQVDFNFSDEAEKALRDFIRNGPPFATYATWTEGNKWLLIVKDSSNSQLRQVAGKDARIFPVTYLATALRESPRETFAAYAIPLTRSNPEVRSEGAKAIVQRLFNKAVSSGIMQGVLSFSVGDDLAYVVVPATQPVERVLPLASVGKLEIVAAGEKALPDDSVIATTSSPSLNNLNLPMSTTYTTLADNDNFSSITTNANPNVLPTLQFSIKSSNQLFEYSRNNLNKYIALVLDRRVIMSGQLSTTLRDKAVFSLPRFATAQGRNEINQLVELVNAKPSQLFETKEIVKSPVFAYSGSFK